MFKIGQQVRLKSNLIPGQRYGKLTLFDHMYNALKNKTYTISKINKPDNTYFLEEDPMKYYVSFEMLMPITKPTINVF